MTNLTSLTGNHSILDSRILGLGLYSNFFTFLHTYTQLTRRWLQEYNRTQIFRTIVLAIFHFRTRTSARRNTMNVDTSQFSAYTIGVSMEILITIASTILTSGYNTRSLPWIHRNIKNDAQNRIPQFGSRDLYWRSAPPKIKRRLTKTSSESSTAIFRRVLIVANVCSSDEISQLHSSRIYITLTGHTHENHPLCLTSRQKSNEIWKTHDNQWARAWIEFFYDDYRHRNN